MSGGHFGYWAVPDELDGAWMDEEVNYMFRDLFIGGEFSVRGYGGLMQSLDFALSGDIGEDGYREALGRFKAKWLRRTPKNRVKYYQDKLQECCDRLKGELALGSGADEGRGDGE